jgi:predicted  nucleic acid-binding Zn-ribbon protein
VPQVSVKDQLKKLVELQEIDSEIYLLQKELNEKPVYIESLKQKYEDKKSGLKKLEERLKAIQVERKSHELELQTKENDLTKANTQLSQLKTNREYQAKLVEIENLKADKSIIEEKILLLFDEADGVSASIEKEKGFLFQEEKKYLDEKKQVDDAIKEIQEKLTVLQMKRSQVIPEIEKVYLNRYERILENKDGLAIVAVKGSACGGCFMAVPDQIINELKMHDKLIFCEMCARILYLEDDL